MRRLLIALFLLAACSSPVPQRAVAPGVCTQVGTSLAGNALWEGDCGPATPAPTETPAPTDTATATETPSPTPTDTAPPPTEIDTPAPTDTPLPPELTVPPSPTTGTPIPPFAAAQLCSFHDPTAWHALWDGGQACHYDHTHNADPTTADAILGPLAYAPTTLSYAWATSSMENSMKHGGYKYGVRLGLPCGVVTNYEGITPINCITDARIQYHGVGHALDALARFHSFYAEYRICRQLAYTQCGIIRIGGWADFGILEVPYKGARVVRPGGVVDFGDGLVMSFASDDPEMNGQSVDNEPYLAMSSLADLSYFSTHAPSTNIQMEVWSSALGAYSHQPYVRFAFRIFDSWGLIDPANPNNPHWLCRDGSCAYNASWHALNELTAFIPQAWDTDGDGLANFEGFTNRYGQVVTGCTASGLDCVPLSVVNVPVGYAHYTDPGNGRNAAVEYDTSPPGVRWIEFPN